MFRFAKHIRLPLGTRTQAMVLKVGLLSLASILICGGCCTTRTAPIANDFFFKYTTCGVIHPDFNIKVYYRPPDGKKTMAWPAVFGANDDVITTNKLAVIRAGFPNPKHASMKRRVLVFKAPSSRVDITDWLFQKAAQDAKVNVDELVRASLVLKYQKTESGVNFKFFTYGLGLGRVDLKARRELDVYLDWERISSLVEEAISNGTKLSVFDMEYFHYQPRRPND